ncbi:MAG: phosphoenolpyruvate--protein phosphotransferase [Candidatus Cloacimonetes bacterium]|nr:phosphoenolpyruvate--protein phosphotransferase [Candidatus Cloacimonadota bacterium]
MKRLKGIQVANGYAVGKAAIVSRPRLQISRKQIGPDEIEQELQRFQDSLDKVKAELNLLIDDYAHSRDNRDILTTHKLILEDPEFIANITTLIRKELLSLEQALHQHFTEVIDLFRNMENSYYAEKSSDFEDVAYRLLSYLTNQGRDYLSGLSEGAIVITENVTPSGVARFFGRGVKGIVAASGSRNSHSAIIARSMNLPFVARVANVLETVSPGDELILDGYRGEIILDPDEATRSEYRKLLVRETEYHEKLLSLRDKPAVTSDGHQIRLMSNIELPLEVEQVLANKSEGIGLFRTEFLFLEREELPDENEQYEIYKKIAEQMYPEPVIIRTIDVGGDKLSRILNIEHELNPNLGCRGIRISLGHIPIFKNQIRAILRAGVRENVKIMFPMIASCAEIIQVKRIVRECVQELRDKSINCAENIKLGAMVEIPSAAINSFALARECDFLSIGTNDLIQYTLAVDRDNQSVEKYYIPHHPAVLKLIRMSAENAHKNGIKLAVCGEMASQSLYVPLLIGLGVDELSVSPGLLLEIKELIRSISYTACRELADKALELVCHDSVLEFLKKKD